MRSYDLPVTEADIELIPDILMNPDKLSPSPTPTSSDQKALIYKKQYGGRTYYVESINKESKTLQMQSMYINNTSGVDNQLSLPDNHGLTRRPNDSNTIPNPIRNGNRLNDSGLLNIGQ